MRTVLITILAMLVTIARAEFPSRFATRDRIVTIEQWGSRGQLATVWAVLPTQIVVYRVDSSLPDEFVRATPIAKEDETRIRQLVSGITPESRGKVWLRRGVFDGLMLRISFTADGSFREDRIEVQNLWRTEFAELLTAISEKLPADSRITFKGDLARMPDLSEVPIIKLSIQEYYRNSKEEPNKAPQSTTTAVTPPAGQEARQP